MGRGIIGKRISELRKKRGLTQTQLANKMGMSHSSIAMWERETRDPDSEMITKLSDFFEVSTDYLLGRTDDPYFYESDESKDMSPEVKVIHRAAKNMTPEERERMLQMMKLAFDKAFEEDD